MTGPALTLPTVNASNGTWGTTVNAALNQLNGLDVSAVRTTDSAGITVTTLADDTTLAGLTLGIGTWLVKGLYLVTGPAAGDFKVAWVHSGTATGYRAGIGPATSTTTVLGTTAQGVVVAGAGSTTALFTATQSYGLDGTNVAAILEEGVIIVTVAGTLKIQWAQVAVSTATVLKAGSLLYARQVA